MNDNPAADWQALAENYRQMYDKELERLGDEIDSLTDTAQQVLRTELKNRGLVEPGAKKAASRSGTPKFRSPNSQAPSFIGIAVDPDALVSEKIEETEGDDVEESDEPHEYTWRTLLCDCDTEEAALQLKQHLRRAGIESWIEAPGRYGGGNALPRLLVAADELEHAIEVAQQPILQDIVDDKDEEIPEYAPPTCPACGAEDPVLEAAEPSNSWLCEVCGKQWSEPVAEGENADA